jgi:Fe-S cluster assembly protein SufD
MNLLSAYETFKNTPGLDARWSLLRQSGYDFVLSRGFPSRQDEDWHYTSVKSLADKAFNLGSSSALNHDQLQSIQTQLSPQMTNLVFVNAQLDRTLSADLPPNLSWTLESNTSSEFEDSFEALNAVYLQQFFSLKVAAETAVEKPVHFVFVNTGRAGSMTHPRLKVVVGSRSVFRMIETYISLDSGPAFTNSVVDVYVGESAKMTYIRSQGESLESSHIGRTRLHVAANATLESLALTTGAALSRHSLRVSLNGPGSNSEILGLYATKAHQHLDNTSWIDHNVGECNSNQLYKGILDDESRAVFCGQVYIAKNAQKANSTQLNNNLLLSSKAEANSKPCLKIYADDVKAAHGSTVGQLNKEELFYMQSRAISKEQAIPLLALGFLSEVIYKISDESLQKWLVQRLEKTFADIKLAGVSL